MAAQPIRIGIDLGGTKIEALAIGADGHELIRRRQATPAGDYRATLHVVAALVESLENELGSRCSVGVGTPGSLSPDSGLIRNANSVCLNNKPLDRDLGAILERPVRLANDADCFALSEAVDGAGANAHSVFGVILGTGVGGGLVYQGRLISGPNAIAGEWGHNPLPWPRDDERPGTACYCGRSGCIETFVSGPALEQDYFKRSSILHSATEIAELAALGDTTAEAALQSYEQRLARALASVVNIFDPEVIVLGGGLSQLQRLYTRLPAELSKYVFSDTLLTRLCAPQHGDSSGVRGAAWLWPDGEQERND